MCIVYYFVLKTISSRCEFIFIRVEITRNVINYDLLEIVIFQNRTICTIQVVCAISYMLQILKQQFLN